MSSDDRIGRKNSRMSAKPPQASEPDDAAAPPPKSASGGKKKLILLALPLLLVAGLAGAWFSGLGPRLLGHKPPKATAQLETKDGPPVFAELPDIIANLSANGDSFIKLKVKLELAKPADQAIVTADMPRLLDLFQTYLRDMRPDELRGSAGTYRLREELIARADIAIAPAHVQNVLFTEMLIQ
jgi:flagellar FliL protein